MTIIIRYLAWVVVLSVALLLVQSFIFLDFSEFNLFKQTSGYRASFSFVILLFSAIATGVHGEYKKGKL